MTFSGEQGQQQFNVIDIEQPKIVHHYVNGVKTILGRFAHPCCQSLTGWGSMHTYKVGYKVTWVIFLNMIYIMTFAGSSKFY
jgi:hypothetical protein